jgi:hypothetical protein
VTIDSHRHNAEPPIWADAHSMPITTMAVQIRAFGARMPRPGARQLTKMSSGRNADTSMFGASTSWLIFRSTATLQMA